MALDGQAKLDHQFILLRSVEAALSAVAVRGGWQATRLERPTYPVGYFELTGSTPVRGQGYLRQEHRGIVSVYTRTDGAANPEDAFRISHEAFVTLDAGVSSIVPGLEITKFNCGELTPRNPDGMTWGRSFLFTAITHEVT